MFFSKEKNQKTFMFCASPTCEAMAGIYPRAEQQMPEVLTSPKRDVDQTKSFLHPSFVIAHLTCCGPSCIPVSTTCSLRRGSGPPR